MSVVTASPSETFLERESAAAAASPLPERQRTQTREVAQPQPGLIPATLQAEFWEEEDGSWAAHVPVLGVTAIAETQADVYAETAEVVEQLWDRLNDNFETLAPHLRDLLELRQLPLAFSLRSA